MSQNTGSCLCGSVKYSVGADPIATSVCHCEDCQRHSGTAFAVLAIFPAGSVEFENKETLTEFAIQGQSGADAKRYFCSKCGSSILSLTDAAPEIEIIKAGSLDDKSALEPAAHYWCESAQPWVDFGDKPQFQGNT